MLSSKLIWLLFTVLVTREASVKFGTCQVITSPKTLNGTMVHCFHIYEIGESEKPTLVEIYKLPWNISHDPIMKLVFIEEYIPDVTILREGEVIPGCVTVSKENEVPDWVHLEDATKIAEHLRNHCFVMEMYKEPHRNIPFKLVFKIDVVESNSKKPSFSYRKHAFVLPDNEKYLVFAKESDLFRFCTSTSAVKSFGQPGLSKDFDVSDLVAKAGK